MIAGHRYWVLLWYGILLLGVVGLGGALFWARETQWKNLDEVFRGIGTIAVSVGMLLLLYGVWTGLGQLLMIVALVFFVLAFLYGRRGERPGSNS